MPAPPAPQALSSTPSSARVALIATVGGYHPHKPAGGGRDTKPAAPERRIDADFGTTGAINAASAAAADG